MGDFSLSVQSLFFEQVWFSQGTPPRFFPLVVSNLRSDGATISIRVRVRVDANSEFPATFRLIDMGEFGISRVEDVDVCSLETVILDAAQQDIVLEGGEAKTVLAVLLPFAPAGTKGSPDRTSFFNVNARLVLSSTSSTTSSDATDPQQQQPQQSSVVEVPISAVFCTPIDRKSVV
jgi:hypothetical protein